MRRKSPHAFPNGGMMRSHTLEYQIFGDDMQIIEIELDPVETVIAEAGAMNYMEDGISFETRLGDGTEADQSMLGKMFTLGKRALTGESLFLTHFTNRGQGKKRVAFAAPYPGKIIPIDLAQHGGVFTCQKDAFLCAAYGTSLDITFNRKIGTGLFGGEGFILETLSGDGLAFIHAGGTVVQKRLNGEMLRVDTGCIVGFTRGIEYSIETTGSLKSMVFGGEGIFLATLKGTGTVYLQSLPFSRLADRILRHMPKMGGSSRDEGSVIGGLGRLFE